MQGLIDFVLLNLNYLWVFIFMMVESSFIPFPSEVIVPPAAFLSMMNDNEMNFLFVIIVATAGADGGALVNYYLAKWLGRPIVYRFANSRFGHMCLIDCEKVEKAEAYFREHGAASTFFGRLIPAVRQLISIPAGLSGMPIEKFLFYTTLGAGIWNSVLASLGWFVYIQFDVKTTREVAEIATKYSHEIGYVLLGLTCIVVAVLIYKGAKRSK